MTAPTFKKATDTDPGTSAKYGAPDLKYITDVLDGTHSTDRLQLGVIEGVAELFSNNATFAFYVRQVGEAPNATYQAIRSDTGAIEYSGSDFGVVMNSVIGDLPFPSSDAAIGIVYLTGTTLDCKSTPIIIDKPNVIIDGLGASIIRKTTNYSTPNRDIFTIRSGGSNNVTIRNLTVEDTVQDGNTTRLIAVRPDTASVNNIMIDNVRIKNSWNAIYLHAAAGTSHLIENSIIRNCWVDNAALPSPPNNNQTGPGIVLGLGCKNVTVHQCYLIEPGGTGIEVFGTQEYIKIWGNYILKSADAAEIGTGIDVSNYGTTTSIVGAPTQHVSIRDNRILGVQKIQDGIRVWGGAEKVIVANNFIKGGIRDGIVITLRVVEGIDRYAKEVMVLGNIVQDMGRNGMLINSVDTIEFQALQISNNYIHDVQTNGINLLSAIKNAVVANNMVYRYGLDAAADRTGIQLRLTSFSTVTGNQIFGLTSGQGSNYTSIREEGAATTDENIIVNNSVNHPITIVGANSIVAGNNGFKTEASGTVSTSASSVAVTHGLGYTPALREIFVTPTTAWGSMASFWVSSPTSTQFTINLSPSPGQTVTFAWQISRSY